MKTGTKLDVRSDMDFDAKLMKFTDLTNDNLLFKLKSIVARERELLRLVIEYLEEVEVRKLHLDEGYSSMFAFCTEYLNYSPQEAQTRIQAMRLARSVPEVKTDLESANISLSLAAKVQGHIQRENKIRKTEKKSLMTVADKRQVLDAVRGESVRSSETILFSIFPHHEALVPEKIKQVAASTMRLEVNLPIDVYEKLIQLKNLRAAENLESLVTQMVGLGMSKWDKAKNNAPQLLTSLVKPKMRSPESSNLSRHIPSLLRRNIWQRDKGQCQYKNSKSGRTCGEKFGLHIDHIEAFALGGEHSEKNLRLLCARHNLHRGSESFSHPRLQ
jgi:hypothetical protein